MLNPIHVISNGDTKVFAEVTNPVKALDIKTAVQDSCNIKWQKRWEAGAKGRQLFDLWPSVNVRTIPVQSIKTQRIVSELRTGYCWLNEYRYKTMPFVMDKFKFKNRVSVSEEFVLFN